MTTEPTIVQAVYSFKGTNNDELCFKKGDKITVTQKEEGGWWEGTLGEKTGWFPSNYVKDCKDAVINTAIITQQQQNRAIVLKDLIESEKAQVTELQGLVNNFLNTLEKSGILTYDEFKQLTGNLSEVLETHQQLLALLDEEDAKPSSEQKVGKLFLTWAPKIKMVHQGYCSLHPKAVCILDKYKEQLTKFMESCGAVSPGLLVLTTGLSKPFRRLEKYSGMLQELERHVEECHPDRGDIQRSVAIYKDIAATCSATRRQKELELQVLTGPIKNWEGQTLSSLGDIVYMGSVAVGLQRQDKYFVLFPNNLVILSVSPRLSAFIYEGKLPLSGLTVTKLDDNEQYKNAFEITGAMIEKRVAVCQSKEEACHWVELLKRYMPPRTPTNNNHKIVPSKAEFVPQPPPHPSTMNQRGYTTRTSILSFNYYPSVNYKETLPPPNYPPASPYAGLTRFYRSLIKRRTIDRRTLKRLLYPEFERRAIDLSAVKRRQHVAECMIITSGDTEDDDGLVVIKCDSDTDTDSDSSSNCSDAEADYENRKFRRQNAINSSLSSSDDGNCNISSSSSSNPFGYIRYYNPQTGSTKETAYESGGSMIDHGADRRVGGSKASSIVVTTTAKLQLVQQTSATSDGSSMPPRKPYTACEDLPSLDANLELEALTSCPYVPTTRQSLPPKFVANKFNESSLTNIPLPNWQSSSDNCINRKLTMTTLSSSTTSNSTTAHSSSIQLPINPIPLPDRMVAELLYNNETAQSESFDSEASAKTVIKPPKMFHDSVASSTTSVDSFTSSDVGYANRGKKSRRFSIELEPPNARCTSYRYLELYTPSATSTTTPTATGDGCSCCTMDVSPRSSDSGMAGSYTLNSPDIPVHDHHKHYECPCTSPFSSTTPSSTTSCVSSTRVSSVSSNNLTPFPVSLSTRKREMIPTQKSKSLSSIGDGKKFTTVKVIESGQDVNDGDNDDGNKLYKSGLYAHWWLKAKIPIEVVRGMYEGTAINCTRRRDDADGQLYVEQPQ